MPCARQSRCPAHSRARRRSFTPALPWRSRFREVGSLAPIADIAGRVIVRARTSVEEAERQRHQQRRGPAPASSARRPRKRVHPGERGWRALHRCHARSCPARIAALSSASSTYIRLSLAFSALSSRMRVRSETFVHAYLLFLPYQVAALMPLAGLRDRHPRFAFLQDRDDLALRELALPRCCLVLLPEAAFSGSQVSIWRTACASRKGFSSALQAEKYQNLTYWYQGIRCGDVSFVSSSLRTNRPCLRV